MNLIEELQEGEWYMIKYRYAKVPDFPDMVNLCYVADKIYAHYSCNIGSINKEVIEVIAYERFVMNAHLNKLK